MVQEIDAEPRVGLWGRRGEGTCERARRPLIIFGSRWDNLVEQFLYKKHRGRAGLGRAWQHSGMFFSPGRRQPWDAHSPQCAVGSPRSDCRPTDSPVQSFKKSVVKMALSARLILLPPDGSFALTHRKPPSIFGSFLQRVLFFLFNSKGDLLQHALCSAHIPDRGYQ